MENFDDNFEELENPMSVISKLKNSSRQLMMEAIYQAIVGNVMGALKNDAPVEEKVEAVETVIKFFVELEEYEKCNELKKVIDKIKIDANY
jgi:hypothetical protein